MEPRAPLALLEVVQRPPLIGLRQFAVEQCAMLVQEPLTGHRTGLEDVLPLPPP
jgi:hypothetical protein